MSAPRLSILILAVVAIPALGQTASKQNGQLPSQARPVQGVVMPVPKEIFRSLDQFAGANWRAVQRLEIVHWKSHGDQAQIAILLGVVIAEGFIATEAEDSTEVRNVGNTVLKLAGGLGVKEGALRRSRSIMEHAEKNEWAAVRTEWDDVLSEIETGMIQLKSASLSQLVSLGGWLRGTEALSALVLQNYSPERSKLIRQPILVDYLEKQIVNLSGEAQSGPIVVKMLHGIRKIRALISDKKEPLSEGTVRQIHGICNDLVRLSSQRPTAP